jgi:hypothetical protein
VGHRVTQVACEAPMVPHDADTLVTQVVSGRRV